MPQRLPAARLHVAPHVGCFVGGGAAAELGRIRHAGRLGALLDVPTIGWVGANRGREAWDPARANCQWKRPGQRGCPGARWLASEGGLWQALSVLFTLD